DPQRILRALEVFELSGRPLSELWRQGGEEPFPYRVLKLVVTPAERQVLHRRIETRFQRMVEAGLVAEVQRLRARGDLTLECPALRSVGYRQIWEYLDGLTSHGEMMQRGIAATRQLARRQLTWLRAEPDTRVLDSTAPRLMDQTLGSLAEAGLP
ncbi:MAG: tRNA dimethylallyltransferase, partial [Candidatus Competibacteraceae bacterium]|nr:tRNA dimethylallyltransferase [Candidatus Competibacteraceae bacterium]